MTDDEIRDAVLAEIAHAEAKHAPWHVGGDRITNHGRLLVLELEVVEASEAWLASTPPPHDLRSELIDVMAVCVQWLRRL